MLSFVAYVGEYLFVSAFIRGTDGDADMKRPTFSRFFLFSQLDGCGHCECLPQPVPCLFCPSFNGNFLKRSLSVTACLSAYDGSIQTATAAAVATMPVQQCKTNMGMDANRMPTGACDGCYRASRRTLGPPLSPPS